MSQRLAVAGNIVRPDALGRASFVSPAVGCEYALVWRSGSGEALLDGQRYTAPVRLAPGPHTLQVTRGSGPVALVWARAAERGFRPFYQASREERQELQRAIIENIL